jgi:hypothetical protein
VRNAYVVVFFRRVSREEGNRSSLQNLIFFSANGMTDKAQISNNSNCNILPSEPFKRHYVCYFLFFYLNIQFLPRKTKFNFSYLDEDFFKQFTYFQKRTYMFILRGISTATMDSFFSADDGTVSAVQHGGNSQANVVRQRPCSK